ncbi:MAG: glutamyl-tRNA reductase, partial [Methanomethylophilus sp.]
MACLIDIVPGLEKAVENALKDQEDLVSEYVIIRTCNRLEAYVSTDRNEEVRNLLDSVVRKAIPFQDREYWYFLEDKQSIKHLFTVVCGIDSLIVGEDQIQHQIRESYAKAVAEGHVSSVLKALF